MKPTAMRLGSAPLTLDWSHLQIRVALEDKEIQPSWDKLKTRFSETDVGFYDAPCVESLSQVQSSLAVLEHIQKSMVTDCLILGIGGSFLGPVSLLQALSHKIKNGGGMRLHFLDNPDPIGWKQMIDALNPQSTFVISITKSGSTFETMALTLLALQWLGAAYQKKHFLGITDPVKGDLRSFLDQNGLFSLSIPVAIGGRFSVFSSVGILPALLAGVDVFSFLKGAQLLRDFFEKTPLVRNPLFILAHTFIRYFDKKPIHVMMPYATPLKGFASWFVQLWAESLGKKEKGFTPLAALGATDQHSLLQLLSDGPNDKVLSFIIVNQFPYDFQIPKAFDALLSFQKKHFGSFDVLEGYRLAELLEIEYQATAGALIKQNRLSYSVRLDALDEKSLGALYFFYATLTAVIGVLWDMDPFNQPGVEETKRMIGAALTEQRQQRRVSG